MSGDLLAARLQRGLARANCVVLVVSANSLGRGWVEEEYAAAVAGVVAGTLRLIPALLGDVPLSPFVASRLWVDFRAVTSPQEYLATVAELAAAVRSAAAAPRPAVGEPLVVPSGLASRAEGPTAAVLRISRQEVRFTAAAMDVSHRPAAVGNALLDALYGLDSARAHPLGPALAGSAPGQVGAALKDDDPPGSTVVDRGPAAVSGVGGSRVDAALARVGEVLGRLFLAGAAGDALARGIETAQARNSALRLGVEVLDEDLADLPWETLRLPGGSAGLSMIDRVEMHRLVRPADVPRRQGVAVRVAGPLKILAVVASPSDSTGPLLDYEAELGQILDAVDPARTGAAEVRVLEWGTLGEIRASLNKDRFHVLHLSCHAGPGVLQLERADGTVDEVDVDRFIRDALPADRGVPLIVLAGCSTALTPVTPPVDPADATVPADARSGGHPSVGDDAQAVPGVGVAGVGDPVVQGRSLAGLARGLVARGAPAVLAMTAAVTDRYSTALAAQLYSDLASAQRPHPLAALSRARRTLETARAAGATAAGGWAEWATPALYTASTPVALFDRADPPALLTAVGEPVFQDGMVVRRVGEFVGRRGEQRHLLAALRSASAAGVLVHGIGGVGKSTLTAQLIHHLGDAGGLLVPVNAAQPVSVDSIFETLRSRLNSACVASGVPENNPLRRVAVELQNASSPWRDRLDLIRQFVLPRLPLLVIIDNAETLLAPTAEHDTAPAWGFSDPELGEFLAALVRAAESSGGRVKLLITSRYPFALPSDAQTRLLAHHLGPLSLAETRKLIWRLPALDALSAAEQVRAVADVGGHPRTLEYLDALLAGGHARFADLDDRMRATLNKRGIPDPQRWLTATGAAGLDRALAEAVTLSVDDTLLEDLLATLTPAARGLLDALAVHRAPVDRIGAAWAHQGPEQPPEPDPALLERLGTASGRLQAMQARVDAGEELTDADLADADALQHSYTADLGLLRSPPVDPDDPAVAADLARLTGPGLATPSTTPPEGSEQVDATRLFVHRWTATALAGRVEPDRAVRAHRRAAAYHAWRVAVWPQDRHADITDLLEARHHHHAAGDLDQALAANDRACDQLDTWGAWEWSRTLHEEALAWTEPTSRGRAVALHQLGNLAQRRGDYPGAETYYRNALAISEELGDRSGGSAGYHQLGMLAYLRGDYAGAEDYYRTSLAIDEKLADRSGASKSYHHLGMIAQRRGDYPGAETHYRNSLAIKEQLGDRSGMSRSYHQLGILAQDRGDYPGAEAHYRNSLAIKEELGDRLGMSLSYGQLGNLAYQRGDYPGAETYYRNSLAISEELGDRSTVSTSYHQLGILAQDRGDYPGAEAHYRNSLAIKEELGDRSAISLSYGQLGILAQARGDYLGAETHYRNSLAISEELGDRSTVSTSYHQLGMLAQRQGDYPGAETHYRNSLAIAEELGDRSSIASTVSQLGILAAEQGNTSAAVAYQVRALAIRLEIQSPQVEVDLHWLRAERAALGEQDFAAALDDVLNPDDRTSVIELLDQPADSADDDGTNPTTDQRG